MQTLKRVWSNLKVYSCESEPQANAFKPDPLNSTKLSPALASGFIINTRRPFSISFIK